MVVLLGSIAKVTYFAIIKIRSVLSNKNGTVKNGDEQSVPNRNERRYVNGDRHWSYSTFDFLFSPYLSGIEPIL